MYVWTQLGTISDHALFPSLKLHFFIPRAVRSLLIQFRWVEEIGLLQKVKLGQEADSIHPTRKIPS